MRALRPCTSCARHVRIGEAACPFCGAALATDGRPLRAVPTGRRIARAIVAAAGIATAGSACTTDSIAVDAYGVPPLDASALPDAEIDAGFVAMDAYGLPPQHADAAPDSGRIPGDAYGAGPDAIADAEADSGPVAGDAYGSPPDAEPADAEETLDLGVPGDAYGAVPDALPADADEPTDV